MNIWYLIHNGRLRGAYNMSLDMALVSDPPDRPVLRFYDWNPPAVSLGYNQRAPEFDRPLFAEHGIDVVRRPTGGRAVLHIHEVTYSVVFPAGSAYATLSVHELYRHVSEALEQGLRDAGYAVDIEKNRPHPRESRHPGLECFGSTARFEIKSSGRKIVGSAQRRLKTGILQHGSILLSDRQRLLGELFRTGHDDSENGKSAGFSVPDDTGKKAKIVDRLIGGFERVCSCRFESLPDEKQYCGEAERTTENFAVLTSDVTQAV